MDFALTVEQDELTQAAAEFARRELNHDLAKREDAGEFSLGLWQACAKFGILGLPVPAEYGGAGVDLMTAALVMEALGYGCQDNGLLFSLSAQMWSVEHPLVSFGTPEQKRAYLPGLVSGDIIGGHAMTEPGAGSDALHMHTRADRRGDQYLLNGTKQFVTNAPVADVLLVYACTAGGSGGSSPRASTAGGSGGSSPRASTAGGSGGSSPQGSTAGASAANSSGLGGLSVFLVDAKTPGLTVSGAFDKMGLRTSPIGEIALTDCLIPAVSRLGPEGAAMAIFNSSMEWERSCLLASSVGAMRRQLETCVAYARTREQFGQPIGKFQAVAAKLADMYVRLEASRLLIYRSAWLKQQGRAAPAEAAAAKLFASESWVRSSQDAIQVHGATGYMKDAGIERDLRDATASTIYSGTSEIQRVLIARMLGL